MAYCIKCGTGAPVDAAFCAACGKPIADSVIGSTPPPGIAPRQDAENSMTSSPHPCLRCGRILTPGEMPDCTLCDALAMSNMGGQLSAQPDGWPSHLDVAPDSVAGRAALAGPARPGRGGRT